MNKSTQAIISAVIAMVAYFLATRLLSGIDGSSSAVLAAHLAIVGGATLLLHLVFLTVAEVGKKKSDKDRNKMFPPITLFFFLAVALFLATPFVSASTPEYLVTPEFRATLDNTENQHLGTLIISPQPHVPDEYTLNNFTTIAVQRFDRVTWTNNQHTIIVTSPQGNEQTIVSGGSYVVANSGTHTFRATGDPSLQGVINAATAPTLQASLSGSVGDFPITFTPNSFTQTSADRVVNMTVSVPQDFPPQTLPLTVLVDTNFRDQTISRNMTLPDIRRWEVVMDTVPSTINISGGDTAEIGYFLVNNQGNVNYQITSTLTGNGSSYLQLQSSQTMFRNTNSQFDLRARVPSTQADGSYPATITLSGGGQTFTKNLTVVVQDLTPPVIGNMTFTDERVQRDTQLRVPITDNIAVTEARINIPSLNVSEAMTQDNQLWFADTFFPEWREYEIQLCAKDAAENTVCEVRKHMPARLDLFNTTRSVSTPSIRHGNFARALLFNLTENPPEGITVRLDSFDPSNEPPQGRSLLQGDNSIYHVRLVDGDGSFHRFNNINGTVTVYERGEIYLEVRAATAAVIDRRASFSGVLSYETPAYHVSKPTTSFDGVFVDYNLPQPFNIDWGTGGRMECDIIDTGSLDTSRGECLLTMPAEDISRDLVVPITLREKEYLEERVAITEATYQRRLNIRNAILGGLIAGFIILLVWHYWMVSVKPRLVFIKNW